MNNFYQNFECLQTFSLDQKFYYRYDNYCNIAIAYKSNKIVTSLGQKTLEIWDLLRSEVQILERHNDLINSIALTPDEQIIISASEDGSLRFWELATGKCLRIEKTGCKYFVAALLSPADDYLVTSEWNTEKTNNSDDADDADYWDYTFRVFDMQTNAWLLAFKAKLYGFNALTIAPNGNIIIVGTRDNSLVIYDINKREEVCCFDAGSLGCGQVYKTAIAPDGDTIAVVGQQPIIKIFSLTSQSCVAELHGHEKPITSLAITPDGKTLVSGSYDQTIRIWDIEASAKLKTTRCLKVLADLESDWQHNAYTAIAISPNQKFIVSVCQLNNIVKIWGVQ
jgi:WD40 repeat protein